MTFTYFKEPLKSLTNFRLTNQVRVTFFTTGFRLLAKDILSFLFSTFRRRVVS